MIIDASRRSDLVRDRVKYTEDYNKQLKAYQKETSAYQKDYDKYSQNVAKLVRRYLSPEIRKLPETTIDVRYNDDSYYGPKSYYVEISYTSPKKANDKHISGNPRGSSGYAQGISWHLTIYIRSRKDRETGELIYNVSKNPRIYAEFLESDDYEIMDYTRKLFLKIDKLDWQQILNDATNNIPKREDYGTTDYPGRFSTDKYDSDIDTYDIERIVGTDEWVKVEIDREKSYNRWSRNSRNAGIHGEGWMKLNSMTNTYYFFNFINSHNGRNHGYVGRVDGEFSKQDMEEALSEEIKMNKAYFSIVKPVEYRSTEELTAEDW